MAPCRWYLHVLCGLPQIVRRFFVFLYSICIHLLSIMHRWCLRSLTSHPSRTSKLAALVAALLLGLTCVCGSRDGVAGRRRLGPDEHGSDTKQKRPNIVVRGLRQRAKRFETVRATLDWVMGWAVTTPWRRVHPPVAGGHRHRSPYHPSFSAR